MNPAYRTIFKGFLILIIFLVMPVSLPAQEDHDSLLAATAEASDREKIDVFIRMAKKHSNSSLDKSLDYAHQALEVARLLDDTATIIRCHEEIGRIYMRTTRTISRTQVVWYTDARED